MGSSPDTSLIHGLLGEVQGIISPLVTLVGEGGFEPPTSCTQSRNATTAPLPGRGLRLAAAARLTAGNPRRRGTSTPASGVAYVGTIGVTRFPRRRHDHLPVDD